MEDREVERTAELLTMEHHRAQCWDPFVFIDNHSKLYHTYTWQLYKLFFCNNKCLKTFETLKWAETFLDTAKRTCIHCKFLSLPPEMAELSFNFRILLLFRATGPHLHSRGV